MDGPPARLEDFSHTADPAMFMWTLPSAWKGVYGSGIRVQGSGCSVIVNP